MSGSVSETVMTMSCERDKQASNQCS